MDLLEDPETKKKYDRCKYIVKLWEHQFTKQYKRIPSRHDIKEAPSEVRHAYRKYYQLKSAALEHSFMDVEGFEIEQEMIPEQTESPSNLSENVENISAENVNENSANVSNDNSVNISQDVWGSHLNNKTELDESQHSKVENKLTLNSSLSKKLFCGSKFNKRNPRKSLSFSQKNKSSNDLETPMFLSQPTTSSANTTFTSEESITTLSQKIIPSFMSESLKIVTPKEKALTQPVNIIQSVLENNYNHSLKKVDTGWLNRLTGSTRGSSEIPSKVDYDSDEIIDDSEDEQEPLMEKMSALHVAKRRKIEQEFFENYQNKSLAASDPVLPNKQSFPDPKPYSNETLPNTSLKREEPVIPSTVTINNQNTEKPLEQSELISNKILSTNNEPIINKPETDVKESDTSKNTQTNRQRVKKSTNKSKTNKIVKPPKKISNLEESTNVASPMRRSSRATKLKFSMQELSSGEEDPFHSDNDEKDPEFSLEDSSNKNKFDFIDNTNDLNDSVKENQTVKKGRGKKKSPRVEKSKKKDKNKMEDETNEEESTVYELEFSVKPRIVAPRYDNVKTIIKDCKNPIVNQDTKETSLNKIKSKQQLAKEKLEEKIASGNLNDNFVTVNLKKKIYSRHRSGNKFAKFKKSQWKANKKKNALCGPDMNMGGCDGGALTCFTCGQEGHFAQNCKATEGDKLLPLNAKDTEEPEECPFITLEQASQMAKESVLSIRRPRNHNEDKENDSNEETSDCEETNDSGKEEIDWGDEFKDEDLLRETLKLEEHIKKLDVQAYMDNVKVVEPYFKPSENVTETPIEVFEALQKFGHSSFRGGQEKAIMRILSGKSTLVTLSTGSGKSLCYQLPAYLYANREPCISLIISPLVSLMEDQVTGIPKFLKAACLHTNQSKTQREKILESLSLGELSILLISPEAVVAGEKQTGFGSLLRKLPPIAFACIDEAHCVSQWSHNFRPSYLMICRVLRESLGVKTILGLTATATRSTCDSIIEHLEIPDGYEGIISDIPLPDNLTLTVSKDANKDVALLNMLLSERFMNCQSIIIYCTRRDECERIASFLRTSLKSEKIPDNVPSKKRKRLNLQAEPYHAGLSASRRKTIQNSFMSGALRIVVATVAFGMGINKANIRAVIHFNMPSSFESYVQEVGRAGRDGLQAHCHCFLDSLGRDGNELRRHIHANSIDRHVIRKLLQKIFVPCSCKGLCPKHEVAFSIEETVKYLDIPEENISTLLCYLELHENKYIKLLSPAYTMCKVISYGGPLQIRKVAGDCPPLAMALALHKSETGEDPNVLEFPVIDVAAAMGWDSGICKFKLKNLEWVVDNHRSKRSLITVNFFNLGFRLLAPGNLLDEQLDEGLDSLFQKVQLQEQTALKQLRAVHETLVKVAVPSYKQCIGKSEEKIENTALKLKIREYFDSKNPLDEFSEHEAKVECEEQLINDIRALICMYRNTQFTGRAVARIFHGIQSPNYPAVQWGRCKFWRSHMADDFHEICKIATREIIRLR